MVSFGIINTVTCKLSPLGLEYRANVQNLMYKTPMGGDGTGLLIPVVYWPYFSGF